ncbi:MAG: ATP-binding protein [Alphaproteobacteria bacterium]|jgi:signal transduction histidine kinase|nr:ATP-binding protein [Alphaproteobacteria bacterium]
MTTRLSEDITFDAVIGRFLWLFVPVAVICIGGAIALFRSELKGDLTKIRASEMTSVQVGVSSIGRVVQSITRDAAYLASQGRLLDELSDATVKADDYLAADWLTFSRTKGIYDQIRLLDANGQERERVNFNNGYPASVPKEKLQNKGKRYYFTDTIKLNRGEFFISPLDLNIEGGEIEIPIKPMIRIGTPVFDRKGQKRGAVLLNYLGDRMLAEFDRTVGANKSRAWLLNSQGYWLKGPSRDLEWGFMHQRPETSLAHRYPATWQRILATEQGQFEDEHGLWTYATAQPLIEGQKTSSGTHEAFAPSRSDMESRDYYWKAVLLLPHETYGAAMWRTGVNILAATAIVLAVLLFGCWRLASAWTRQEKAEDEVRRVNQGLEAMVDARTEELKTKNAELESLIYVVSHDLRAPLLKFKEFSTWLTDSIGNAKERLDRNPATASELQSIATQLGGQIPSSLNAMLGNAEHMYPLVNGLHLISRASRTKLDIQPLGMNAMLSDIVAGMEPRIRAAGGSIEIDELPSCRGDAMLLGQVFKNLIDNAIKYRHPERPPLIRVSGKLENGRAVYEVSDNGIGFAAEHCAHVWDLFYRRVLMGEKEGKGLDLTLVQRIVERHQGRIYLESEEGEGSRFIVVLPAALPEAQE